MSRKPYLLALCLTLLTSCGGRTSMEPDTALLGHWSDESGVTHCYFSKDKKITVIGDYKREYKYEIEEIDRNKSIVIIREYLSPDAPARLSFSLASDRNSMTERTLYYVLSVPEVLKTWKYVDSKQQP